MKNFLAGCLLAAAPLLAGQAHATTYTAVFDSAVSDPAKIMGIYQPKGAEVLKISASYSDVMDKFTFRYDYRAKTGNLLGDAYFSFSRDGKLPDGNRGTWGVPQYWIDAQSGKAQITSSGPDHAVKVLIDAKSVLDPKTGLGYVEFSHDVSDVRAIFEAAGKPLNLVQWDGGAFTDNFGLWTHVVANSYYKYDPVSGQIVYDARDGKDWLAFDPKVSPMTMGVVETPQVPLPATAFLLIGGLASLAGLRRKKA